MNLYYLPKTSSFSSVKEYFGVVDRQPFFFTKGQISLFWKGVCLYRTPHLVILLFSLFLILFPEIIQTWTHLKGEREIIKFALMSIFLCFFTGIGSGYWGWSLPLLFSIVKQRPVQLNCECNMGRIGNFAFRECVSVCSTHVLMCMTREKQTSPEFQEYLCSLHYWVVSKGHFSYM